jgi:hypothetical protein
MTEDRWEARRAIPDELERRTVRTPSLTQLLPVGGRSRPGSERVTCG